MKNIQSSQFIAGDQRVRYFFHQGDNSFLPPLVLLHGWGAEARVWSALTPFLEKEGYTFYALDLPGFGDSELPKRPFSVDDYVDIVLSFIQMLGLPRAVLVGHSFGGRIAIKLAQRGVENIERIVLVNSAGIPPRGSLKLLKQFVAFVLRPLFRLEIFQGFRTRIYMRIGAQDYIARPELSDTFSRIVEEDLTPFLEGITIPTLIVWGAHDAVTPVGDALVMNEKIKNSELVVFPHAGHYSFASEPEEFVEGVTNFIHSKPVFSPPSQ